LARFSLEQALESIARALLQVARWSKKFAYFFLPPVVYKTIILVMPRVVQESHVRHELRLSIARHLANLRHYVSAHSAEDYNQIARYRDLHQMSENSAALLDAKFENAEHLYRSQLWDRVRLLRELGRLAALRGHALLGCVYRVRAIRMLGADVYNDLPYLTRTLVRLQFSAEADALAAMYEDTEQAPERCQCLLESALAAHRRPPASAHFERFQDHRPAEIPRVAVIVSLYNAADKLPLFLNAIRSQSLLKTKQMELIFIDSGSPADEYGALTQTLANFSLPYLYVRTAVRESIQTAWNRGITLARAPYLSFLGVDEAVTSEALALLADTLDSDPALDWVQGDSLLTEVDDKGCWSRDIMSYDREGYTQNHVYLETCYLSWVGAMYRRSIHDRFGYYDGSFRATGDNEFKCRILPFIKTQRIPRLLGLFINYPEVRATGSAVAELEDIRAWYLHRTLGGIRYALRYSDPCEVEKLLLLSLRYRKSYTTHFSTDVELASHLVTHLAERLPSSPILCLSPRIKSLLEAARLHDHPDLRTPGGFQAALNSAHATWAAVQVEHRNTPWLKGVEYNFGRDNRHEQHSFLY
jgi:glycosyltransferase involved in cell wall biosynthesis